MPSKPRPPLLPSFYLNDYFPLDGASPSFQPSCALKSLVTIFPLFVIPRRNQPIIMTDMSCSSSVPQSLAFAPPPKNLLRPCAGTSLFKECPPNKPSVSQRCRPETQHVVPYSVAFFHLFFSGKCVTLPGRTGQVYLVTALLGFLPTACRLLQRRIFSSHSWFLHS